MRLLKALFMAFLSFFFTACATQQATNAVWTVEKLIAASTDNDGKQVTLSGVLFFGPETRQLWESNGAYEVGNTTKSCLTLIKTRPLLPKLIAANHRTVRISGTFRREIYAGQRVVDLAMCNDMGIEVDRLEVVE